MKKILSLENFICLVIFLAPTYLIRLNFFGQSINFLDILIIIAVASWFFGKKNKKEILNMADFKYYLFLGIIILGFLASLAFNFSLAGLGLFKSWIALPIIFGFIVADVFKNEGKIKIFKIYYYSAFSLAILALTGWFLGKITYDGRLTGIFNSPNYLAMYIAPTLLIPWISGDLKKRIFSWSIILLSLYLTYSYASWASIFVVLALAIAIKEGINWKKTSLVFFIFLLVVFSQLDNKKTRDLISFNDRSSFSSRSMIYESALKIIGDNWFWGIGLGNFQEKYLQYQKYFPPYLEWAVPHPHNLFLAFWLFGGLGGVLAFCFLIYFWLKDFFSEKEKTAFRLLSFGAITYILIHGFFDATYFKNDLALIFWAIFLVSVSKNLQNNQKVIR